FQVGGLLLAWARSRTRDEAIAFILADLHLIGGLRTERTYRHERLRIAPVPQTGPVPELVRPYHVLKHPRASWPGENYDHRMGLRRPRAPRDRAKVLAEIDHRDDLDVGTLAMYGVPFGAAGYFSRRAG